MNNHLVAFLSDAGFSDAAAARQYSAAIAVGIAGKIGMGLVGDRIPARRAAIATFVLMTAGSVALLAVGRVPALLPVFLVVHGFTVAAENVMLPLVVIECFGARHLARIYGALMFALLPGGLAGPTFAGWMFDRLGTLLAGVRRVRGGQRVGRRGAGGAAARPARRSDLKIQARRGRDVAASTASRARVAHQHARVADRQQRAGLAHRLLEEEVLGAELLGEPALLEAARACRARTPHRIDLRRRARASGRRSARAARMPTASGLRARFMRSTTTCVSGLDALVDRVEVLLEARRRSRRTSRPRARRSGCGRRRGVVGQALVTRRRSAVTTNSVSSIWPVRGTASRNDMKTPISTQNSIEIATAAIAVTATIAASKREARRW